jgi:hypothetical protein
MPFKPSGTEKRSQQRQTKESLNLFCRHFASLLIPQRRLDGPKLQQEPNESAEIFETRLMAIAHQLRKRNE